MPDFDLTPEEIDDIFGGEAGEVTSDPEELEVALTLKDVRTQLCTIAEREGVTGAQLAKRMRISPPAVSRTLHGESDMKISTVALYMRALGQRCRFVAITDNSCRNIGNRTNAQEFSNSIIVQAETRYGVIDNASTTTAGGFFCSFPVTPIAPHSTARVLTAVVAADA